MALETKNARERSGLPENPIAISSDGFENYLISMNNDDVLKPEEIRFRDHETG